MSNEKLVRLHIAAILTDGYQPQLTVNDGGTVRPMTVLECESAKITQVERMYALVGLLCDTPEGERLCPTPAALPGSPSSIFSDPTQMPLLQALLKAAPGLLAAIPGAQAASSVLGAALPPVALPAATTAK